MPAVGPHGWNSASWSLFVIAHTVRLKSRLNDGNAAWGGDVCHKSLEVAAAVLVGSADGARVLVTPVHKTLKQKP